MCDDPCAQLRLGNPVIGTVFKKKLNTAIKKNQKSLEYHHSLMLAKFAKNKNIQEEAEYYLKVVNYLNEFFELSNEIKKHGCDYKNLSDRLEYISNDYFSCLGLVQNVSFKHSRINLTFCGNCQSDSIYIDEDQHQKYCMKCGISEVCLNSMAKSYEEEMSMKEKGNYDFSYKKINHFQEWLNNFQSKEKTEIPDVIINKIICELKKERIADLSLLKISDIRRYLKKINESKYYEHVNLVLNKINNIPPFFLPAEIEKELRKMFCKIEEAYEIYKPSYRKNFLSYPYVIRKSLEIMGHTSLLVYFPLLKARDKLVFHDEIFKKICEYNGWKFIETI